MPPGTCLLTFDLGDEVVSEGGVGAGVAVGGAEAAGAQVGQPLHTRRQQLWAAGRRGGRGGNRREEQKLTQEQGPGFVPRGLGERRGVRIINQESEKGGGKKG